MPRSTGSEVARAATRVDAAEGIRDDVELFGDDGGRRFGVRTTPLGRATGAVLFCPSVANDLVKQYRRDVVLARALAAAGMAVQRFQYRGTGNSDGDAADLDRDSMVADVAAAQAQLEAAAPGVPGAVVATRFGALVAAEAAGGDARPIVFVEPVLDGARYFSEAFRAKLMQGIAGPGGSRPTTADFLAALGRGEPVDVLGNPVHPRFHASWRERTVLAAMTGPPRPVLLVQFGDGVPVRADLEKAAAALSEVGHEVDVVRVPGRETWWYLDERDLVGGADARAAAGGNGHAPKAAASTGPPVTTGLVDAVVPWLSARLGTRA